MTIPSHIHYLTKALQEADKGRGFCAPNPAVGAVIVQAGQIIATGYHRGSGHPHAESEALQQVSSRLENAILYSTLEPCNHYGRTPPCTEAIIARGIKAVYFSAFDFNSKILGRGQAHLQAAGVVCEQISVPAIDAFYASYHHWLKTGLPRVTAKLAMSLDGKIAGAAGEPLPITNTALNRQTHEGRQRSDAILTTVQTVIDDNPCLNVRLGSTPIAKPIYILDRQCRLPSALNLYKTAASLILFHDRDIDPSKIQEMERRGISCIGVTASADGLDLQEVLTCIGQAGVHDLWVEVGERCFSAFLNQQLLDQALLCIGWTWIGEGKKAFRTFPTVLQNAKQVTWQQYDHDVMATIIW